MALIKKCRSPVMVYPNIKSNCELIAAHTIAISCFLIALIVFMPNEPSQIYDFFFETNLGELKNYAIYSIIFFFYMIGSSLLLLKGLNNNIGGFLLPWLIGMGLSVFFVLVWSILLLDKYTIYTHMIGATVIYWILAFIHFLCWLCVYTQYHVINEMQSPNIEHFTI